MVLAALVASTIAASVPTTSSRTLWDVWPTARAVHTPAPCLRPADVAAGLQALVAAHPERLALEEVWRDRLDTRPLLPALASRLAVDALASLVQLRLGEGGAFDPEDARLERVWIDGRVAR
jgi:hypothetical protein